MTESNSIKAPKYTASWLILVGTIAGSIALSIVSAYETWLGLVDFMPKGVIGGLMAVILTFGVQIILFAISWSIAEHVRDGFKANIWRIGIWIMCAFFSGYFSFYGFFQGTGGRAESVRTAVIEAQQDEIMSGIEESFNTLINERHQAELVGTTAYQEWIVELGTVINAANGAQNQIDANNQRESANLRDRQRVLRDERDQLSTDRNRVEAAARQSGRILEDLRKQFEDARARGDTIRNSIIVLEGERDALEVAYEQEASTGVGPRTRALELDLNSKEAELLAQIRLEETNAQRIAALESELATAEIAAEDGVAERRRNEIDKRLADINDEIQDIENKLAAIAQGNSWDLQGQSTTLTTARAALEGQDYEAYETLVSQCASLKQQLTDSNVGQSTASVVCSRSDILATVNSLADLQARKTAFQTNCVQNRPEVTQIPGTAISAYDPTIAHLQECTLAEPDQDKRSELRAITAELKTDRGDEALPIQQASVALFDDLQSNAFLSFVFAAIVDLLVLLCALVGKNIGLPENVRAIDKLISMMRKPPSDNPNVEALVSLPNDPRQAEMIDPIVNRLIRDGYAELETSEYEENAQLILNKGARVHLARLRAMLISEETVTGTDRPDKSATTRPGGRTRPREPI